VLLPAEVEMTASPCLHLGVVVLVTGLRCVHCMVVCEEVVICPYARPTARAKRMVWEAL